MQWSLERIYREQVNGNIPPRKHLNVLGENTEQSEWDLTLKGGTEKGGGRGKKKVQKKMLTVSL